MPKFSPSEPVFWGFLCLLGIGLIVLFALTGCATTRYFSDEEDAKAREVCQETGCALIPIPLLQSIIQRLQGQAI